MLPPFLLRHRIAESVKIHLPQRLKAFPFSIKLRGTLGFTLNEHFHNLPKTDLRALPMKSITALVIITFTISGALATGSESGAPYIVSGHWTGSDGLPVETVNSLTLDDAGELWIGTHDGLARFDGFKFSHFNADSDPALPGNRINQLFNAGGQLIVRMERGEFGAFDGNGYRRIGQSSRENLHADDSGLWFAKGEQLMRWEPESGTRQEASFDELSIIHPDSHRERLLVGTETGDVIEYHPAENRTRIIASGLDGPLVALATSPNGHVGAMTRSSFLVLAPKTHDAVQTIPLPRDQWDHRVLTWTPEGWQATLDGPPPHGRLVRFGPWGIEPIESAPHDFHHFVLSRTDELGRLWVNQGTRLYRDGELVHEGEAPIYDFVFDRYGQVWLGSRRGGLKRLAEPVMQTACPQGNCLDDLNTYLVTEYDSGLLIGNQFALYHHDPKQETWTRLLWFYPLSALAEGDDLLVGGNGLCRLQSDGTCAGGQPTPDLEVRMLKRDHTGAIWKGTDRGLFRRDPHGQLSKQPLTSAFVRTAVTIEKEHLIFGTAQHGVLRARIDSPSESITVIADTGNGLASNAVRSLHVLGDGRVLVGLEDRGMCLLSPTHGVERCISVTDGLPHHSVHRMIEDDFGRLWVNTNNGIYFVALDHLVEFFDGHVPELTLRRFDTRDGMPSAEGNGGLHQAGTRTADGRIWFPNQNGIVIIDPSRVTPAHYKLSARITPLGHSGSEPLSLHPEARFLRLLLGATALRGAEAVQFRYRLNEQAAWNPIGSQPELTFDSLAPGRYQLQVQARYHDGQWPDEHAELPFNVPPRLAERTGFWVSLGAVGVLFLGGLLWRERGQVFRLEHQVEARTAELRQALTTVRAQAADIRRAANRRHQLFLAISHELRTPLTLVLGPLRDQAEPPDSRQLQRMRRSAEQMQTLIDQILDLEQVEHTKADELQPLQLSTLLTRVLETVETAAEARSIELQDWTRDGDDNLWVQADGARLERALLILLDNAIKYAPCGGVARMSLSLPPYPGHAAIRVEDNGPGVPPDHREGIFEPFFRGTTDQPGLGLGLALCRRIIEQHGGTINLGDSELGGACFTLELPLVDAPVESAASRSSTSARILVVDDNPGIRTHVSELLAGRYQVLQAASGHEAERLARSERPDVLLIDVSMPHMDGFELLRRLRDDELTAAIPAILFTAYGHRDTEVQAFRAGADHYFEKPFTADQLLTRIERALTRGMSAMDSETHPEPPVRQLPDIPSLPGTSSTIISRLEQVLNDHLDDADLDVDQLAALSGISRASLYRRLHEHRNATPAEFIRNFRLRRAAELLRHGDASISEVAFAVGFRRLSTFTRAFRAHYNCTPSDYRKAGQ